MDISPDFFLSLGNSDSVSQSIQPEVSHTSPHCPRNDTPSDFWPLPPPPSVLDEYVAASTTVSPTSPSRVLPPDAEAFGQLALIKSEADTHCGCPVREKTFIEVTPSGTVISSSVTAPCTNFIHSSVLPKFGLIAIDNQALSRRAEEYSLATDTHQLIEMAKARSLQATWLQGTSCTTTKHVSLHLRNHNLDTRENFFILLCVHHKY
ncbi:unnamed protein product [Protopolystoma xenopodis]|uniref:Uncharacterized protein n=1 Tax=Protopolystoma xenopodis TaxID=117903 RepID=A0A448WW04_9PLAT|nr:unnamed protein product [Protopolystoma xenopodis]